MIRTKSLHSVIKFLDFSLFEAPAVLSLGNPMEVKQLQSMPTWRFCSSEEGRAKKKLKCQVVVSTNGKLK